MVSGALIIALVALVTAAMFVVPWYARALARHDAERHPTRCPYCGHERCTE
jgi:hypothetical protein